MFKVRTQAVSVSFLDSVPVGPHLCSEGRSSWGTNQIMIRGESREGWRAGTHLTGWMVGKLGVEEILRTWEPTFKTHGLVLALVLRHLGLLLGEQTIGQFPGTFAYSCFSSAALRELMPDISPSRGYWKDQSDHNKIKNESSSRLFIIEFRAVGTGRTL